MIPSPRTLGLIGSLALFASLACSGCSPSSGHPSAPPTQAPTDQDTGGPQDSQPDPRIAQVYNFKIVGTFPHDPTAYTQGLLWDEGHLIEGTGRAKESYLRKVKHDTGRVMRQATLRPTEFGEGVCRWKDTYIQLTWKAGDAIVWDAKGWYEIKRHNYKGEGWGLTVLNDQLVMSNGTSDLTFRDPETFEVLRTLPVRIFNPNSKEYVPIGKLNELEAIDGEIWANVYQDESIVRIDPETGYIASWIDFRGLQAQQDVEDENQEVQNGIAHDPATGRLFITGKYWPNLYQIELVEKP